MIHATFTGRVVSVKQFGNLVVVRAVSGEKEDGKFKSQFVDLKLKGDGYDGQDALKYQPKDDITAIGELKDEKWTKGDGSSAVMLFPRLITPWAIRQRGNDAEAPADDNDPFAGLA